MSVRYSAGRFEWLSIPDFDEAEDAGADRTDTFLGKPCPQCGWIDGIQRFEVLAGQAGGRECFRCGHQWDVNTEITDFLAKEKVDGRLIAVRKQNTGLKKFYRTIADVDPRLFDLRLQAQRYCLVKGFDELISLSTARIERFEHQEKTALKVLKHMKRVLLADEVGLGKTVEAGMVVRELRLRGMAQTVLILVPAALQVQWRQEMMEKFDERFKVFRGRVPGPEDLLLIASYDLAKRRESLLERRWDVLILDECHRLKNRHTAVSKFVRRLRSHYLLALSATPIQNNLGELYAQIDLVQPGKMGTFRSFRRAFVSRTNPCRLASGREAALKEILSDTMIRNSRDSCGIRFTRRRAGIYYIRPTTGEMAFYNKVTRYIKKEFKMQFFEATGKRIHMLGLIVLQRELMSSPAAVRQTMAKIARRTGFPEVTRRSLLRFVQLAESIDEPSKFSALQEILSSFGGQRFVVFTEFVNSALFLQRGLHAMGHPVFALTGRMPLARREAVLEQFRAAPGAVLVSTETGGEGLNLQCCSHLVNYDLPWNPTRIEQRIGRLHRIGQKRDVYVFNLVCTGTIEEHVVNILAKKLRMFEMVIGECGTVLGHMNTGRSFEQMVCDVWLTSKSETETAEKFGQLGEKFASARTSYDQSRQTSSMLNQIGCGA